MNILKTCALYFLGLLTTLVFSGSCLAQAEYNGGSLASITNFNHGELGGNKVIIKSWAESFDGLARYQFSIYGNFNEPLATKKILQDIYVIDGDKKITVYDWNSPDCSIEKVQFLRTKKHDIFLILAQRDSSGKTDFPMPQNEPAPQVIKFFKLTVNSAQTPGVSRNYFSKIGEVRSRELACGEDSVYKIMTRTFNQRFKE